MAEEVFQMPVRLGTPLGVKGLADYVDDAIHATSVGLLRFGQLELAEAGTGAFAPSAISLVGTHEKLVPR